MNPDKVVGVTFLAAIGLATIGETRGGLPSPRRYAAVCLAWWLFGLAAELGGTVARFAAGLAGLTTLAMAMGKAGERGLAWIAGVTSELAVRPAAEAEAAAAGYGGPLGGAGSTPMPGRPRPRPGTPPASGGGGGGSW